MAAPQTVVYQFVDYLSVLLQSGKIVTVWNGENDELVYSSLGDQDLINRYGQPSPEKHRVPLDSTYAIQINHPNPAKDPNYLKEADYHAIDAVIRGLEHDDPDFLHGLIEAVSIYRKPVFEVPKALELESELVNDLLKPMRKLIDEVFHDLRKSHVFRVQEAGTETVKLFAVARTVRSSNGRYSDIFSYTASLLLSDAQRAVISHILEKEEGTEKAESSLAYLEAPLGLKDRSVADTVFCSGNVGFKGKVGSYLDVAGDDVALERQRVENLVYKKLHEVAEDRKLYVFYTPVHVAGVPWLALFTFTRKIPQDDREAWERNYHIYRDVVPRITSQIRSGTRQIYLHLVADKLTARLHQSKLGALPIDALIRGVSQDWQEINQVYPYARLRLKVATDDSPQEMVLHLGDGKKVAIEISQDDTFLRRDVQYDLLDKQSVPKACKTALERYLNMNTSLQQQTAAYHTHSLRNPLLTLRNIVKTAELGAPTRLALTTQVNELLALERFSNYLVSYKEARKPTFVPAKNPQRFDELQLAIANALEVHEDSSFESNSESLLQIKADRTLTISFEELEALGTSTLEFCAEEMNIVVNGLITNALKYNKMAAPELHVSTILDDGKVFLQVRNPSDDSSEELQTLAAELSSPADIHLNFVGVNLIHLACRACKFSAPVWEETDAELVATAQIARYRF